MKACLMCGADLSGTHVLRKFCYACQRKKEAERVSKNKPGGRHNKTEQAKKGPDLSGRPSAAGLSLAEAAAKARQAGVSYGQWQARQTYAEGI